ncbi:hypothetical protein EC968_001732 [Mortierella alpina]|nr:hypothetical protein EC968_001732 [Mortierella alpina]
MIIIFIIMMGMGLQQAPNTERWRRIFLNTSGPNAVDESKARIQKWLEDIDPVEDPKDERVRLVRHVMRNLLKAIQSDGVSLQPFLCDKVMETSSPSIDRADRSSFTMVNARSVNVHVSKQLEINAYAMLTQDIAVSSGMLRFIDFDEDLAAAVLAHELAHLIQGHTREPHSLRDLLIYAMQWSLWGVHMQLGPYLSCLPMAFALTTPDTMVQNPVRQALEIEADTISLKIMALAGYDPIHAARFYDKFAALDEKTLLSVSAGSTKKGPDFSRMATTTTTKIATETLNVTMEQHNQRLMAYAQRRWYHSTHPSSRFRQQYLTTAMYEVREKFRISEELRSQPIERFCTLNENRGVSARMEELKARVKTVLHYIRDLLVTINKS